MSPVIKIILDLVILSRKVLINESVIMKGGINNFCFTLNPIEDKIFEYIKRECLSNDIIKACGCVLLDLGTIHVVIICLKFSSEEVYIKGFLFICLRISEFVI